MKTTADFIEALKAKYGLKSNYAVAKFLNQTDTAIARWSNGKTTFSDETAMHVAYLLDLDPAYVVASVHAERAKHANEKKLWERIATSVAGVAAALAVVAILPFIALPSNDAGIIAQSEVCILCQMIPDYWWMAIPLFIIAFYFLPKSMRHDTLTT